MASKRNCCLPNCRKTRDVNVVLHTFPDPGKEQERFNSWMNAAGSSLSSLDFQYIYQNRRICHDHFEERYLTWTRRLTHDAVPTLRTHASPPLRLNSEKDEEDNAYETEIREQNEIIEKLLQESNSDETEVREQHEMLEKLMAETNKASKAQESYDDKQHGSKEYQSTLVPIAPNRLIIAPQGPTERRQYAKFLEQYDNSPKKPKVQEGLCEKYSKILYHDNAIYKNRISKLLANQDQLKLRIKELETKIKHDEEDFVTKVKEKFAHVFTSNQVDIIMGKKSRVWWNEGEYTKAYTLHHISKNAYSYVRDTLNYPFPACSSLQQWAAKFVDEMPDSDDDEIEQPVPKHIKLTLDKTTKKYHSKKKVTDCAIEESEIPSDTETTDDNSVSDIKEPRHDYLDIDEDSERNQQSDRQQNVEATEPDCYNGDEMYEEIDYLDEHADNENDGCIQDKVLDNDSDKSSNGSNSLKNDIDDYNNKMDEQSDEIDEQGDDYFEELIIDNVFEEDNG